MITGGRDMNKKDLKSMMKWMKEQMIGTMYLMLLVIPVGLLTTISGNFR